MHPRLFEIGPFDVPKLWILGPYHIEFTLHTYGVLLAIAFLAAIYVAVRGARREGIPEEKIFDLSVYTIISALVGAKLLLIVSDLRTFIAHPSEVWSILRMGGVFYGGFLFGTAVSYFYLRRHALSAWKVGDAIAPGIALGQAIGRLGCFAAGCCYGKPSNLPWAFTFRDTYAADTTGTPIGLPLHPTQMYESIAMFMVFAALLIVARRKSFDGQVFWLYALAYSVIRFGLEFVRNDPRGFVYGVFSTSQFIAVLMFPISLWMYARLRRKAAR